MKSNTSKLVYQLNSISVLLWNIEVNYGEHQTLAIMNQYKSQLLVFYKVENSKFLIGSVFFLSFIIHLFLTDFDFKRSFMIALVQCLSSWILAFVFIQFRRKYYNSTFIPWWIGFYIALICLSVISLTILN